MNQIVEIDVMDYFEKIIKVKKELEENNINSEDEELYKKVLIELYQHSLYFHYLIEEEKYEQYLESKDYYYYYDDERQFFKNNESIPEPFISILKKLGFVESEILDLLGVSKDQVIQLMKELEIPYADEEQFSLSFDTSIKLPYNTPLFYRDHTEITRNFGKALRQKGVSVAKIQALLNLSITEIMVFPKNRNLNKIISKLGGLK